MDSRTEANIATLYPKAQVAARKFMEAAIAALPAGYTIEIIDGSRTYAQQNALYAKGRTTTGPKVTNARGGQSWHNFGIAWDVGIFHNGKYLDDDPLYKTVGKIGEDQGLEWGGSWTGSLVDEPHFELKAPYTLAQMRAFHDSNKLASMYA